MDLNDFLEEAAIMKEMKHANLVQLLGMHSAILSLPHIKTAHHCAGFVRWP